jgi:hypothetical protein
MKCANTEMLGCSVSAHGQLHPTEQQPASIAANAIAEIVFAVFIVWFPVCCWLSENAVCLARSGAHRRRKIDRQRLAHEDVRALERDARKPLR